MLTTGRMERLATCEPERRADILAQLSPAECLRFDAWFEAWADRGQRPPGGEGWRTWLLMAGRGFGKTRAGAEWVHALAQGNNRARIALVGATIAEARAIMVEGVSGLLRVARVHGTRLRWEPSAGVLRWPRGAVAQIFSGESPEGLRGPEHHYAWLLTFELFGDAGEPRVGAILDEASGGSIGVADERTITGVAVHGSSLGAAIGPLLDYSGVDLDAEAGRLIGVTTGEEIAVQSDLLRAGLDRAGDAPSERIVPGERLPRSVEVDYYDPARDYQSGRTAAQEADGGVVETIALPIVLDAERARGWAEARLRKAWRERRTIRLALPPSFLGLRPGALLRLGEDCRKWRVRGVEVERLVVHVDAVAHDAAMEPEQLPSDAGRDLEAADRVAMPTRVMIVEPPDFDGSGTAVMLIGAADASPGWRAVPLDITMGGRDLSQGSSSREAIIGTCTTALEAGSADLVDRTSSMVVELADPSNLPLSIDEAALLRGGNLAMVGEELLQFATVEVLGDGRVRLSTFLRGRRGSDWAIGGHGSGEPFMMIEAGAQVAIPVADERIGARLEVAPGGLADDAVEASFAIVAGRAAVPPAPVHPRHSWENGTLVLEWTRRSRDGFAWRDGVDAPLGEANEAYRIELLGPAASIVRDVAVTALEIGAEEWASLGPGPWTARCAMIGDRAVSRPLEWTID